MHEAIKDALLLQEKLMFALRTSLPHTSNRQLTSLRFSVADCVLEPIRAIVEQESVKDDRDYMAMFYSD